MWLGVPRAPCSEGPQDGLTLCFCCLESYQFLRKGLCFHFARPHKLCSRCSQGQGPGDVRGRPPGPDRPPTPASEPPAQRLSLGRVSCFPRSSAFGVWQRAGRLVLGRRTLGPGSRAGCSAARPLVRHLSLGRTLADPTNSAVSGAPTSCAMLLSKKRRVSPGGVTDQGALQVPRTPRA